jgi:membrane protease YdiL (CAAX protease family)
MNVDHWNAWIAMVVTAGLYAVFHIEPTWKSAINLAIGGFLALMLLNVANAICRRLVSKGASQ